MQPSVPRVDAPPALSGNSPAGSSRRRAPPGRRSWHCRRPPKRLADGRVARAGTPGRCRRTTSRAA
eukprot:3978793-Pleurochrysis_carterae.AAC.1